MKATKNQQASTKNIPTRSQLCAAWNCRITREQHAQAVAVCRDAGLDKSDLARTALSFMLEIARASGRLPGAIERQAIVSAAATICQRSAEAARSLES
jgi:hypothetical protein